MSDSFEENPFTNDQVAKEWIASVENECGFIRDKEIYPRLRAWSESVRGTIVDIGSGQGICSQKIFLAGGAEYLGIEPSFTLTARARELYGAADKKFIVGDAYALPLDTATVEACFLVSVWFHLGDLDKAAAEMARVLKPAGKFFIITANPAAYETWRSFYFDETIEGKKITGKIQVPINPLSKNIFYQHSEEEMLGALSRARLTVAETARFGRIAEVGESVFMSVSGSK